MTDEEKRLLSNEKQRIKRHLNGNLHTKRYEKTKKGFLMRAYRNMQSRVVGIQWQKHHLYQGRSLLDRSMFYEWALTQPEFHRLFDEWERGGYGRKSTPSVDRIDSTLGYSLDNMEWVTHSENSRRGAVHNALLRKIRMENIDS